MTTKKLIAKLHLDDAAFNKIQYAVQEEEKRTTGEIACAITPESATYSFYELVAAMCGGAVLFALLLCLAGPINRWLDTLFWEVPVWLYPLMCGTAFIVAVPLVFALVNIPALDRLVIPEAARSAASWKRAMRCFAESGVYKTREQSGVLIFVSYLERNVHILADSGIASKIAQERWDEIAATLADELSGGNAADAFCNAIHACGELLAKQFPPHPEDNPDELADGLMILEGGE